MKKIMKKNYITPIVEDIQIEEESFIADSNFTTTGLDGIGGYGGKTDSKDPASRLFDDLGWDDDDEY